MFGSQLRSTRDLPVLDRFQQRLMKIIRGLKHLSLEDRLSKLGWFTLETRRLGKDLINVQKGLNLKVPKKDAAKKLETGSFQQRFVTGERILKSRSDMILAKWLYLFLLNQKTLTR